MNFSRSIATLKRAHLYRQIRVGDDSLVDFCANDYLGLKQHPEVIKAFKQGADEFGVGSGGAHLISGHSNAHQALEEALADYTGQARALLFSTGYMANLGVFSALKDKLDWVLQDRLNHASLIDANHLIGLPLRRYLHNNIKALEAKIAKQSGQGLIATDGVFSMEGDRAQIAILDKIAKHANALLYQDDAHGFGVFVPNIPTGSIYMATLGKAAGVMGAFVAGEADLIDFIVQKSRPYRYTTALPPALCVAALKSLELIKGGEQKQKLFENINFFKTLSESLSLPIADSQSAIQPLIIGSSEKALKLSQQLLKNGFYLNAIRPPTVPNHTARLRITLSAQHTKTQIKQLLIHLKNAL